MSAPKALRATSLRDSLAKTVKLLTKQGIDVQFRGHQPFVQTKGNKVARLVLPELNDDAPPELIEALQGFLDHEVGHIYYTPFAKAEKFAAGNRVRHCLTNIVEDIRLEKLLPRDLPGTKENLERMYDSVMPTFFGPYALKANEPGIDKSEAFSCVMVCAMRALAGQKAFQKFMDDNKLWPHFMPLISKMPNISRRLRDLETFEDVERLVTDVLEAMKPPPPPEKEDKDEKGEKNDGCSQDSGQSDDEDDGASDEGEGKDKSDTNDGDETDGDGGDEDDADTSSKGKSKKDKSDKDDDDGEGHGDGEGTDDGNPDDEEEGDSSGDEAGDDGSGDGGDESDKGDDDKSDRNEGDQDEQGSAGEGRVNRTLRDALAALEPKHRRALFLYKKKRQTVAEIAADLETSEDQTRDMLAQARRQVRDFLNGG